MAYLIKKEKKHFAQSDLFNDTFQLALKNEWAFAIWQKPQEHIQHCVLDFGEQIGQRKLDLEDNISGFAVSPFVNVEGQETYFIKADLHFTQDKEISDIQEKLDLHTQNLDFEREIKTDFNFKSFLSEEKSKKNIHNTDYQQLVQKGIDFIKAKKFQKVVLSRRKTIDYHSKFNPINTFKKLAQNYKHALVYLCHIPNVGTWMGASPETLISVDKNKVFRTVSLAGTQAYKSEMPLSQTAWTQKEIEEQALVSRYIINCFKKIRLREFEEEGPKTVIAGNLVHLKTNFAVDMQATNFMQLGTVMLELLHPTSAVCGMPKQTSLDFILENENYNREFYSGFLGPVNIENDSHLFVNLRCMQLLKNQIYLYAGAGITEDSIPEKEFRETEMKCQTLLKYL